MILARSSSSDGRVASALIPLRIEDLAADARRRRSSACRSRWRRSTATLAAATGSRRIGDRRRPGEQRRQRLRTCVPSRARRASRFFVTLKPAPACRICRRRSVTSATRQPGLVGDDHAARLLRASRAARSTSSSFCDRSTDRLRCHRPAGCADANPPAWLPHGPPGHPPVDPVPPVPEVQAATALPRSEATGNGCPPVYAGIDLRPVTGNARFGSPAVSDRADGGSSSAPPSPPPPKGGGSSHVPASAQPPTRTKLPTSRPAPIVELKRHLLDVGALGAARLGAG